MRRDVQVFESTPWLRTDQASWQFRRDHLWDPRVAEMNKLVETLRHVTHSHVPYIDPFCGGRDATILLVLLRPGPKGAMASDFLSLANNDATARNTIEVLKDTGIGYSQLVFWNAIPWSGARKEKITPSMIDRGARMLDNFLPFLPSLRAVVLVGGEAQRLRQLVNWRRGVDVSECAHPGPFVWNQHRYQEQKRGIFDTFRAVAALLS